MKETLAQALVKQEQEQRLRTEQRLSNVLTENEAFKAQLVHLRSSNLTVMEKADQETQEKLQNGPVMTEAGPNNNGEVESRVVDEESIVQALQKEKTLLLERLRVLESSNSAMVLEGEKQQEVYDRCLDEVASQVVQALLIQRELKEECTKLRNRVEELEIHNRQLRHLFEQEIWMQKQSRESCSSEKGSSHQSLPDNSCANSGTVNGHLHNGPSAVFKHTFFSQTEMHQWPHHLLTSHLNGNNGPSVLYPGAFHRQVSLPNACFSGSLPPGHSTNLVLHNGPTVAGPTPFHKSLPSSLGMDGYEEFAGGGECLGSSDVISDLTSFGPSSTDFSGNHPHTGCDAKNVARKTQSLPTTPLTQRSATYHRHLRNQTTFEFTENHNYLSDKYTKPYVHAPLDYAQSLLHELQEIGASVKSFESLTLEPRSNPPQKRKSFGDLERTPQPQKLVKGHGFDDCLRSNCLSHSAENADTFSLEDFPPDGMGSITSGESIETAYERIIPSPEKSPQKNNMLVPAVQVNDALAVIHVQGDVLFDIDENLLENDNQNGELLASAFSAFSSPIKQKQEAGTENDQWGSQNTIEKTKEGNGCEEETEKQVKDANKVRDSTNKSSVCDDLEINKLYPMTTGVSERKDSTMFPNASSCSNIEVSPSSGTSIPQPFDLHDVRGLENIEMNRSSPLWKIEADQYEEEEQPPLLPPRTNLISRSFESISDEVFMADNSPSGDTEKLQREVGGDGDETKRTAPPELPPKPMWMRIGDISLSPDSACEDLIEPPPVPERRPIEPEGQECLSWQWRESYDDTSEMETTDDAVKPENRTLWNEAADKISETDVELRRLISSESEPEEEGVDYLAMWKAREKSPSWKTCMDTDCSVDVKMTVTQSTSSSTGKTNVVQSGKDNLTVMQPAAEEKEISNMEKEKPAVAPRQGLLSAQTDDKEKSASTPMIEVNVRKESLGKVGSDSKLVKGAQKKHKSSIPLFKSKKDASRKGQSVKEKSVVKDMLSTIKAVMDSSSKGGEKFKSGNPLRRSFRSKSQKPEPLNGKKSNGHCPKSIPEVKGKKMPAPARVDKGVLKLPQVLSKQPKVPNNIDPAANEKPPMAKFTKQSSIPKVQKDKSLTGKPSNHTADKQPSGIPRKLEITARTDLSDDHDDAKLKGGEPQKNTASVMSLKEKDSAKERQRATPTKGDEKTKTTSNIQLEEYMLDKQEPHNLKWELQDRTPSKGSLNLELSESEFSKSRRSSVESLGSLGSFTVEGVPFIDEPGTSPDQETVREIQELSKQFSNLSNGSISQEGPSPLKADWEISEMEKNNTGSASSVPQDSEQLVGKKSCSAFVDEKDVDDIKKGKLVRDFDLVNYNMNILASRAACTLPALGKNCSDPNLSRSKVKSLSRGHSPPERPEKLTQSDSDLQGARGPKDPSSLGLVGAPKKMIQVPLVNGEIFDTCDEVVAMDENGEGSLENGGEHEAQLSEKERATLLDSLFETDSDEDRDDGSCSQDASELASSDSHPDEKEFLRLLEDKGDAKRHVVRQITHNRVSLMHVDICSVYNRFGDKERQALSSFDFLEKVLNQEIDGENSYFEDEMNNGTKRTQSQTDFTSSSILQLHPNLHLSNLTRPYMEDTQGGDGQVSPFAANHELTNTSMSSSLSTGSLSS
ncbi:uncharacterized protein [Apostichopus japonicus]